MKGEKKMKRFVCALLILCLLPICSNALDLSEFNAMSYVLGASEIDESKLKINGKYSGIMQDGCSIYFIEESGKLNQINIYGEGDKFLAYCCAAIKMFDPNGDTTTNHGKLLTMYLLAHMHTEYQAGQTTNGKFFFVEPDEKGFVFMIGES